MWCVRVLGNNNSSRKIFPISLLYFREDVSPHPTSHNLRQRRFPAIKQRVYRNNGRRHTSLPSQRRHLIPLRASTRICSSSILARRQPRRQVQIQMSRWSRGGITISRSLFGGRANGTRRWIGWLYHSFRDAALLFEGGHTIHRQQGPICNSIKWSQGITKIHSHQPPLPQATHPPPIRYNLHTAHFNNSNVMELHSLKSIPSIRLVVHAMSSNYIQTILQNATAQNMQFSIKTM